MIFILNFLILALLVYFLADFYFEWKLGVTTVASSKKSMLVMLDFIPEDYTGEIVDFGSAWGGLVLDIARARPKARVIGLEFNLFPYLISVLRLKMAGVGNVRVLREDFFNFSLEKTGIVLCYLPDGMMGKLAKKFGGELTPGAVILSHDYPIPGWTPDEDVLFEDTVKARLYVYRIKK